MPNSEPRIPVSQETFDLLVKTVSALERDFIRPMHEDIATLAEEVAFHRILLGNVFTVLRVSGTLTDEGVRRLRRRFVQPDIAELPNAKKMVDMLDRVLAGKDGQEIFRPEASQDLGESGS